MKNSYVVGFMFDYPLKRVALIKKNRPPWQVGKLNGVGGRIEVERGESPTKAMVREFKEETGLATDEELWFNFAKSSEPGEFEVYFFVTQGFLRSLNTTTDEEIVRVPVSSVGSVAVVECLPWLIPMAIDHLVDGRPDFCEVTYPCRG